MIDSSPYVIPLINEGLKLKIMNDHRLMTNNQLDILRNLDPPRNQGHDNAPLEWMITWVGWGITDGTILNYKRSTYNNLQQMMLTLRGVCGLVRDETKTRMPLAYTHFIQVLADTFVFLALSVALYLTLDDMCLICVSIITLL